VVTIVVVEFGLVDVGDEDVRLARRLHLLEGGADPGEEAGVGRGDVVAA
jgi:hypothetical protein